MKYKILEDWFFLNEGDEIDTHDSNQQIYLESMIETGRAEYLEDSNPINNLTGEKRKLP